MRSGALRSVRRYPSAMPGPFEQLDFLYMPSRDVAADAHYWTDVLGGSLIFAVDGMGTRVARGWKRAGTFEIPFGPVCSFVAPGGQHIAIYERSRPEVEAHFAGRFDF
jgi:hypothetical protein